MIGVTIGTHTYASLADRAATLFQQHTGLDVVILSAHEQQHLDLAQPQFLQFYLFDLVDSDDLVYFDADLFFLRDWQPHQFLGGPWTVVRERLHSYPIQLDAHRWGIATDHYVNTGLMILNRARHGSLLRLAHQINQNFICHMGSHFHTQSAFNLAADILDLPRRYLDRRYNWHYAGAALESGYPVIGAHRFAENHEPAAILSQLDRYRQSRSTYVVHAEAFEELAGYYRLRQNGNEVQVIELCSDGIIGEGGSPALTWWQLIERDQQKRLCLWGHQPHDETKDVLFAILAYDGEGWGGLRLGQKQAWINLRHINGPARYLFQLG